MASLKEMMEKQKQEREAAMMAKAEPKAEPKTELKAAPITAPKTELITQAKPGPAKFKLGAKVQQAKADTPHTLKKLSLTDKLASAKTAIEQKAATVKSEPEIITPVPQIPKTTEELNSFVFNDQPDTLPADDVEKFLNNFEILKKNIDHPELVSQSFRDILIRMKERPDLVDNMAPENFGIMVRALRVSYGVQITKKSAAKNTRSKQKEAVAQTIDDLKAIGF